MIKWILRTFKHKNTFEKISFSEKSTIGWIISQKKGKKLLK
jgi:hypothetical protein